MTRVIIGVLLFAAMPLFAQSGTGAAVADQAANQPKVTGHGNIPVQVTKTLESEKLKAGDVVEFKTAGGLRLADGTIVPEGSKVIAHVTEAKAKAKGDPESELALVFDKVEIGGGHDLHVKGLVQAVGENPDANNPPPMMEATSSRGKDVGPANAGFQQTTDIKSGSDTTNYDNRKGPVGPMSTGVHGLHGLQLSNDGVLHSDGKDVKLGKGTRVIVHVDILG